MGDPDPMEGKYLYCSGVRNKENVFDFKPERSWEYKPETGKVFFTIRNRHLRSAHIVKPIPLIEWELYTPGRKRYRRYPALFEKCDNLIRLLPAYIERHRWHLPQRRWV